MNVRSLCRLYGVSRSGFYAWRSRGKSAHRQYDHQLMDAISELHQGYQRSYGARRVHKVLRVKGLSCSVRRVNRLMREMGIKARTTGLYPWRPGQHAFFSSTGNQLANAEPANQIKEQWAGDYTYIKTQEGFVYYAVVMDLFSRRIVGWSFARKRDSELTKSALKLALLRHQPKRGCLFHSDQGIEYAAHDYHDLIKAAGMVRSMSRKAMPQDNAKVESFFHTLKAELVHKREFKNVYEAVALITEYTGFYNRERIHSSLNYQSPENYEKLCA